MTERKINCKVVVLGDTAVGKSCLTVRFIKDTFIEYQEPTIGAAFLCKTIDSNNTTIRLDIWDTAGQERYKSLAPMYYRGAKAAIIVYDITEKASLDSAKNWILELSKQAPSCMIILAANKVDLENERAVVKHEINEYISQNNLMHIETSAKTGHNVDKLFNLIGEKIATRKYEEYEENDVLQINMLASPKKNTCC